MANVMLGSEVLVTDFASQPKYGEYKFIGHSRASEIYQRSIPGSSGIFEILSGDRYRRIELQVRWFTSDAVSLNIFLDLLERKYVYETLSIPAATGGAHLYHFCRLESSRPLGVRETGNMKGGTVEHCAKVLTFLQVRI